MGESGKGRGGEGKVATNILDEVSQVDEIDSSCVHVSRECDTQTKAVATTTTTRSYQRTPPLNDLWSDVYVTVTFLCESGMRVH